VGGRLLLDQGLTSGFEERLFVDHEEGVRSVTPSSTNDSPEARKDWPGCGSSVDEDEDEVVVDGAVEDVGEVGDAAEGHERIGRGHERNDYWLDRKGSDLRLVPTRYEKERRGSGVDKRDRSSLRIPYSCHDSVPPRRGLVAYLPT
jgi:hypothetical protein